MPDTSEMGGMLSEPHAQTVVFNMSEISLRKQRALARCKRRISDHAQKHAPSFSSGYVFNMSEMIAFLNIFRTFASKDLKFHE